MQNVFHRIEVLFVECPASMTAVNLGSTTRCSAAQNGRTRFMKISLSRAGFPALVRDASRRPLGANDRRPPPEQTQLIGYL